MLHIIFGFPFRYQLSIELVTEWNKTSWDTFFLPMRFESDLDSEWKKPNCIKIKIISRVYNIP
jgi:hypothetical protein